MLKTIFNEWRRARGQFARVTALSTAILALAVAPRAQAAIITLVCDWQETTCIGVESTCGETASRIVKVDTAKNWVSIAQSAPMRAYIDDDSISWAWDDSTSTGSNKGSGSINRKTGGIELRDEGRGVDRRLITTVRQGTCRVAPQNKF
jgi:hypothetical protein